MYERGQPIRSDLPTTLLDADCICQAKSENKKRNDFFEIALAFASFLSDFWSMNTTQNTITRRHIMALDPCYDPSEVGFDDNMKLTPVEFIDKFRDKARSKSDVIWLLCRKQYMSDKEMRLFAVWCAREALKLVKSPDPRSVEACDVAERFANGDATSDELARARDAAWSAADVARHSSWEAAAAAAWSAADAARAAAAAAARDAARSAAWSAARSAADAAWSAARDAARSAQIDYLREHFEGKAML